MIRGHVFKVRTPSVACKAVLMLGGEDAGTGCAGLGLAALTQVKSSRSGSTGGHVFKVKID